MSFLVLTGVAQAKDLNAEGGRAAFRVLWQKDLGAEPSLFTAASLAVDPARHRLLVLGSVLVRGPRPHLEARAWWLGTSGAGVATEFLSQSQDVLSVVAAGVAQDGAALLGCAVSNSYGLCRVTQDGNLQALENSPRLKEDMLIHRVVRSTSGGRLALLGQSSGKPFAALFDGSGALLWNALVGDGSYGGLLDGRVGLDGSLFVAGAVSDASPVRGSPLVAALDAHGGVIGKMVLGATGPVRGWDGIEIVDSRTLGGHPGRLAWRRGASKGGAESGDVLSLSDSPLFPSFAFVFREGRAVVVGREGLAAKLELIDRQGRSVAEKVILEAPMGVPPIYPTMANGVVYIVGPAFSLVAGGLKGFVRVVAVQVSE